MTIVINVNCENIIFHFVTFFIDMFFKMVYYTTTNIQSNEQDTTISKPGLREYQFGEMVTMVLRAITCELII